MKLLKLLCCVAVVGFTACETESIAPLEQETADLTFDKINNPPSQTRGTEAFIRRATIKKKPTNGYKVVINTNPVNGTPANLQLSLSYAGSSIEFVMTPNPEPTQNGSIKYVYNLQEIEFLESLPVAITAARLAEDGTPTGVVDTAWATPQDNDGVNINNVLVRKTNKIGEYRFKIALGGAQVGSVASASLKIDEIGGGLKFPLDGSMLSLEEKITEGANRVFVLRQRVFDEGDVDFESLFTVGNVLAATLEIKNEEGILVDYEIHNIAVTQ